MAASVSLVSVIPAKPFTTPDIVVYLFIKLLVSVIVYSFAKSFASAHAFSDAKISDDEPSIFLISKPKLLPLSPDVVQ